MAGADDPTGDDSLLRAVAHAPDASPPDGVALAEGQRVGRFRVVKRLGAGGMGVVYEAVDDRLSRRAALKVLPRGDDVAARARFLREGRAASQVSHPNVAVVYEAGESDGVVFIAMELIDGEPLDEWMRTSPPVAERMRVACQIAEAIASAHARGIVHRDLKPGNVMITRGGQPKVLDFGLAKQQGAGAALDDTATAGASGDRLVGTPAYMSPEQARGRSADLRSDVFAFGVLTYELFSERKPFEGGTLTELLIAIDRDEPAKMTGAPPAIVRVVERCLRKAPSERWQNGAELAEAMRRAVATPTRGPRGVVIVVVVALAIGAAAWITSRGRPRADATAAPASASVTPSVAAPTPTKMGDLPVPENVQPAAQLLFRKAMQDYHDGSLWRAGVELDDAIKSDPSFAAAHVEGLAWGNTDATSYSTARQLRGSLSARDLALLDALGPRYGMDPPDWTASDAKVVALTALYPGDAELHVLAGLALGHSKRTEEGRAALSRALVLDPGFALAHWARGMIESDPTAIESALDACIATSPTAASCIRYKATRRQLAGDCDAMASLARTLAVVEPDTRQSDMYVLNAVLARGGSRDETKPIVDAAVARAAARKLGSRFPAIVAFHFGAIGEGMTLWRQRPEPDAAVEILAALEIGDSRGAAAEVRAYLAKSAVHRGGSLGDDGVALTAASALAVQPPDELARIVDRLSAGSPEDAWGRAVRRAATTGTGKDVRRDIGVDAVALDETMKAQPADVTEYWVLGHGLLLAGRLDEATRVLGIASRACGVIHGGTVFVLSQARARLDLADALAQKGDVRGACEWLGKIVAQFGDAKPRSVTAESAKARRRTLACGR